MRLRTPVRWRRSWHAPEINEANASPRVERELADWRHETIAHLRALILDADPQTVEERKWAKESNPAGVPMFSHAGIVCTGEIYKNAVKITFAQGASLNDPAKFFNTGFGGNTRRAIDFAEGRPSTRPRSRRSCALRSRTMSPARKAESRPQ